MTVPRLGPIGDQPTLGFQIADWIEHFLPHGPGDVQGEPIELDDEFLTFLAWAYMLKGDGRRVFRRAVFSRPKGRAKSELAGMVMCVEAIGPARFDHWAEPGEVSPWGYPYETGEPVGVPVKSPFIRCLATEEGQSGNTYDNVYEMLQAERVKAAYPGIDVGLTRIFLPGGGEITPSTASSAAKDGGKETAGTADEPLALDTPIPTPKGWTELGEIKVGDHVFGRDGQPILVWGVSPVKTGRDCFRVTFDDATSIVTDGSHRWRVCDRFRDVKWREMTTVEMAESNWHGKNRFAVPRPEPLDPPDVDLPLDPWVFGMWLGDGDSRAAKLAVGSDDLDVVVDELDSRGFRTSVYESHCAIVRFNHGQWYGKAETSQHALRDLGVLKSKHVPSLYLWGSRSQRLDLLAGLMDSDGYVNERGNCTFTNVNRGLCEAVVQLARSFGWQASIGKWNSDERWNLRATGTWRVSFTPSGDVPFRLPRKAARCRVERSDRVRSIVSIDPVESVPVRCLAVDSDDHLFLAGDAMLPTHNTHLYRTVELRRMHQTVSRNMAKRKGADPWMLETTTAFAPGEDSIAETAREYALKLGSIEAMVEAGFLYDHREAPRLTNRELTQRTKLEAALRDVYGDAAEWMDIPRIVDEIHDPATAPEDARRYWLNQVATGESRWLDMAVFKALQVDRELEPREQVAAGFDGSRFSDSTAIVVVTKDGFVSPFRTWSKPTGEDDWQVDEQEVASAVEELFETQTVTRMYCDPFYWEETVSGWVDRFKAVREWRTNRTTQMCHAIHRFETAVRSQAISHPGGILTEHVGNAVKKPTNVKLDERGTKGHVITKDHPRSPRKIDVAVAAVLAVEAWQDAIAAGNFKKRRRRGRTW